MSLERTSANFRRALAKLEQFVATPIEDERDQAGIVQAFEFTFEQAWKSLQATARAEGLDAPGPRQALAAGLTLGLIDPADEETWLGMLRDRNLTPHMYQEEIALAVAERVVAAYVPGLARLSGRLPAVR